MALSKAQIRAIAIRRKVAGKSAPVAARTAANDNQASARIRGGARMMTTAELAACVAAAGFDQHAAY